MEYTLDSKNGAYGYSQLALVDRVEAPEKYVVKIHLKKPSAVFLSSLTSIQSFPVVPAGSIESGLKKPTEFPSGTGPFKYLEWKPRQRLVLDRFDRTGPEGLRGPARAAAHQ